MTTAEQRDLAQGQAHDQASQRTRDLARAHGKQLRTCFELLTGPVQSAALRTEELRQAVAKCSSFVAAGVACETRGQSRFAIKAYLAEPGDWTRAPDGSDSGLKSLFHAYVAAGHISIDSADRFRIGVTAEHLVCPLQAAVSKGRVELVACMVEAGVDEACLDYTLSSQDRKLTLEELMVSLPAFRARSEAALPLLAEARMRRRLSLEASPSAAVSRPEPPPRRRHTV